MMARAASPLVKHVKRMRAAENRRWEAYELAMIESAVGDDLSLDQTCELLPHRTRHAVKDRYYRAREPQDRDTPAALCDAQRQKDAREGSARLYQALVEAGFVFVPRKV